MLQIYLIRALMQRHECKSDLVEQLCCDLSLSRRSAYNRLNGTVSFSLEELGVLIKKKYLKADDLFSTDHKEESGDVYDYPGSADDFVESLLTKWFFAMEHISNQKQAQLFLLTNSLPFLLAAYHPDLVKLKIYLNARFLWRHPEFEFRKLDFQDKTYNSVDSFCTNLTETYGQLPSTEIWGISTFFLTLKQINLLYNTRSLIDKSMATYLGRLLLKIVDRSEKYALAGFKQLKNISDIQPNAVNFELLFNEIFTVGEYIILTWKSGELFDSFIYNPIYGVLDTKYQKRETERYLLQLKQSSIQLSSTDPERRSLYFQNLREKVDAFIENWDSP